MGSAQWLSSPEEPAGAELAGAEPVSSEAVRLPPYLLTGGRARPVDESLEIEAQVVATPAGRTEVSRLQFENHDIVALCAQPHAVAEVAGRLGLHLGVARVLVGDLVALGYLAVRRPETDPAVRAQIIERVIRGLDRIT